MNSVEIISLVVTAIGVVCFALVFTLLYYSFAQSSIESIKLGKKDVELIEEVFYQKKTQNKKNRIKSFLPAFQYNLHPLWYLSASYPAHKFPPLTHIGKRLP